MFSLAYSLTKSVDIEDVEYPLDVSFDNVLRLIDMLGDEELSDVVQVETGLVMLIGTELDCDIEQKGVIFTSLFEQLISKGEQAAQAVDIKGNPMPFESGNEEEKYSLTEDAEYIYASFMQDYGMDLIEEQGKLQWSKFKALLSGLRDDTKFKKVLEIRQMPIPTGKGTEKERKNVIEMKKAYALKGQEVIYDDEDEDE